jgi:hypothetical protein
MLRNGRLLLSDVFVFHVLYIENGQAKPKQNNMMISKIVAVIFSFFQVTVISGNSILNQALKQEKLQKMNVKHIALRIIRVDYNITINFL